MLARRRCSRKAARSKTLRMRSSSHNVLITGGSRGIGLALAQVFHANGNRVVLIGRDSAALADAAATMPGAESLAVDLALPGAAEEIVRSFPDVSVLVNNAGIQINGAFESIPAEKVVREIAINLTAPLALTHAYLPAASIGGRADHAPGVVGRFGIEHNAAHWT